MPPAVQNPLTAATTGLYSGQFRSTARVPSSRRNPLISVRPFSAISFWNFVISGTYFFRSAPEKNASPTPVTIATHA